MLKLSRFFFCAGACFGALATAHAQLNIRVVETFDYGTGNSTTPHGINNLTQVIGTAVDGSGATHSFLRLPNESFKHVASFNEADLVFARGLNNNQVFCGYINVYFPGYYGYYQEGKRTTTVGFGANGANTYFFGINDDGDLAGSFQAMDSNTRVGKHSIDTIYYDVTIGRSPYVDANAINNSGAVVGEYYDAAPSTSYHGYLLDERGRKIYPIDYPGAASTTLLGINNNDLMVGEWLDDAGVKHGLLFKQPSTFVSFDYPGATATSLAGINDSSIICGNYTDDSGVNHGIIAKVTR